MQVKSVKYNFLMDFILKVSAFVFPLITFPYASRILLPDGIGRVSFATSVISYFQMVAMLGIPTYGIRACAKVRDDKEKLTRVVQELAIINLVTTAVVYVAFFVSVFTVKSFEEEKLLLIITSANILLNTIGFNWLYTALEQYKYITVRSLSFKVLSVIALFAFVHHKEDYLIYASISVLSGVGSNIFNLINIRKFIYLKPVGGYGFKQHITPILVLFAMCAAGSVYTHLDTVMLGFMNTDVEVGYYTAAVKMKNILLSLIVSLGGVMLPRLSYYIQNNKQKEFNKMSAKAFNVIIYISVPVAVYFGIFSKECISFLSGEAFLPATAAMQVIMPTVVLVGLTNMMGYQILVPTNKESKVLVSVIVGAVVDTILNAVLIPKYGALGAAIGTLAAETAVLIVQLIYLRDYIKNVIDEIKINYLIVPLGIALISAVLIKIFINANAFIVLAISALLFFGIYAVGFLIQKEPIISGLVQDCLGYVRKLLKKDK